MLENKVKSFVYLISLSFVMSWTTVNASDTELAMAWKAAPPTKHVVFFELNVRVQFEHANGNTTKVNDRTQFGASYTQSISDHPDGLLIQQEDFKVAEPVFIGKEIAPSKKHIDITKVAALLFTSRPNYIMSPNGDFIRFHRFEEFSEIQNARLKNSIGDIREHGTQEFSTLIQAAMDKALLQEQITRELKLVQDLNKLSLTTDKPIEISITPAYKDKNNNDDMIDGMLSYHDDHDCNWNNSEGCVKLEFNSSEKNLYDAQLVVEPDTLVLHSYHAQTQISIESEQDDEKMSDTSAMQYSHTIERL